VNELQAQYGRQHGGGRQESMGNAFVCTLSDVAVSFVAQIRTYKILLHITTEKHECCLSDFLVPHPWDGSAADL
jgi:hypothetical protein